MLFNSLDFMTFFPVVLLIYYVVPRKVRYIWLLIASYWFYMGWNAEYALLILTSTVVTYMGSRIIGNAVAKSRDDQVVNKSKIIALIGTVVVNLGILFYFKYTNFFLNLLHIDVRVDVLLPVGISFYTFQALSYTIDVYKGEVEPEKNFFKYALFVSFFPQLVAGPIERTKNLLPQIQSMSEKKPVDWKLMYRGVVYMAWGYFLKMVVADRVCMLVDAIFDQYYLYGSSVLIMGAVGFAFQIYCDFCSYSTIAIGAANILGIRLMENFDAPYMAHSIKEFWRRWHISLSTWFRDYVYIPLGGNRKGKVRKYVNLMVTFLVSGLWHGAALHYVAWGGIHGIYQVIGDVLSTPRKRAKKLLNIDDSKFSYRLLQVLVTFALSTLAWIFFRADNNSIAIDYIRRIITKPDWWVLFNGGLYGIGIDRFEMSILLWSIALLVITDVLRYKKQWNVHDIVLRQNIVAQMCLIMAMIIVTVIYGCYGPAFDAQTFIYFQF